MESKFWQVLWNATKMGVLMFAVGAALAAVAPYIAMAVGVEGATSYAAAQTALNLSASPAWLGAFFGAFGVLNATFNPIADWLFGKDKDASMVQTASQPTHTQEPVKSQTVNVIIQPAVEIEDKRHTNHSKNLNERQQQQEETALYR